MSEHIVARALRTRAAILRDAAAIGTSTLGPVVALEIAGQFEKLADTLAEIEGRPVASPDNTPMHPQLRVAVDYHRLASQVEVTPAGGRLTIGYDRLTRAARRMCDAYQGGGTWAEIHEGQKTQWTQLAMIAIEAALGPDHD